MGEPRYTISRTEWKRLGRHGYTHVRADGQTCVLQWIDGAGTCLVPVMVRP